MKKNNHSLLIIVLFYLGILTLIADDISSYYPPLQEWISTNSNVLTSLIGFLIGYGGISILYSERFTYFDYESDAPPDVYIGSKAKSFGIIFLIYGMFMFFVSAGSALGNPECLYLKDIIFGRNF